MLKMFIKDDQLKTVLPFFTNKHHFGALKLLVALEKN